MTNENADAQEKKAEAEAASQPHAASQPRPTHSSGGKGPGPDAMVEGSTMKHCFGVSMGWFMEDLVGEHHERLRCYNCADFDQCYKMSMIKTLTQLRYEVRRAARTVGLAIGGSHSAYPF